MWGLVIPNRLGDRTTGTVPATVSPEAEETQEGFVMHLGLGFGHYQQHRQVQSLRLSHAQRQVIDQKIIAMRLDLIESVWGIRYSPKCECFNCGYKLMTVEILKGFSDDVNDTTVPCPVCETKLQPKLIHRTGSGSSEVYFYCPTQTTERLRGLEVHDYDYLYRHHPILVHSAGIHFGNIANAFASIGIDYPLADRIDWREKVGPFLGLMPDTQIAQVVGVSVYKVRKMRKFRGLPPFKKRDLLPTY